LNTPNKTLSKTLNAKQLKSMIDGDQDFVLINVLSEAAFDEGHIPGSVNIPHEQDTFIDRVEAIVGDKSRQVVVYCANRTCQASPKAATKLTNAGFTNVMDFENGFAGWRLAGYEVTTASGATR